MSDALTQPSDGRVDLAAPLDGDEAIHVFKLANGLPCWVSPHRTPPGSVALCLWIASGSLQEEESERGAAHFIEHLAFRATEHFPPGELGRFFASMGTRLGRHHNAATAFDHTRYALVLSDNGEATLERAALCLADFAFQPSLEPTHVDAEREVIIEEIRARADRESRLGDRLLAAVMPGSRVVRRRPLGSEESVRAMGAGDLRRFHARWYRPDNATLMIAGDVEPEGIERLVAKRFGEWRAPPEPLRAAASLEMARSGRKAAVVEDTEVAQPEAAAVWLLERDPVRTVGDLRLHLVERLGLWLLDRRLRTLLYQTGARLTAAGARSSPVLAWLRLLVLSVGDSEQRPEALLRCLLGEVARVRQHGFLPEEVSMAKAAASSEARQQATTAAGKSV